MRKIVLVVSIEFLLILIERMARDTFAQEIKFETLPRFSEPLNPPEPLNPAESGLKPNIGEESTTTDFQTLSPGPEAVQPEPPVAQPSEPPAASGDGGGGSNYGGGTSGADGTGGSTYQGDSDQGGGPAPPPPEPSYRPPLAVAVCITGADLDPHCGENALDDAEREFARDLLGTILEQTVLSISFPSYIDESEQKQSLEKLTEDATEIVVAKLNSDLARLTPFERDTPELERQKADVVRQTGVQLEQMRRNAASALQYWHRVTPLSWGFSSHAYNQAMQIKSTGNWKNQ